MKCHYLKWTLILIVVARSVASTNEFQSSNQIINNDHISSCNTDSDCKYRYICNENLLCEHRSVFPLDNVQLEVLFIISLTYGVSTLCGMGGAIIASGTLMWLENFSTSEAIPISMAGMFVTMTYTFYLSYEFKIEHPTQDFASLKAASIIIPTMLVGSKIGTIVNFTFPYALLTLLMMGLVINIINGARKRFREGVNQEKSQSQAIITENTNILTQKLTPESLNTNGFYSTAESIEMKNFESNHPNQIKLKEYLEEENKPLPIFWVKLLLRTLLIYVIDVIVEGSSSFPSIIGIGLCSPFYYFMFGLSMLLFMYLSNLHRGYVKQSFDDKRSLDPNYSNLTEEFLIKEDNKFILLCFCAGIFSSALGIAGGMFLTPRMLQAGYSPKTTTSTSMLLIIFTSFSSTLMFTMIGSIKWDYAILIFLPSLISCYVMSYYLNNYIHRTGKQSIIMFLLIGVLSVSFTLFLFSICNRISYIMKTGYDSFTFNSYCARR